MEFGGGKREDGGMNTEYGAFAYNLHISIFEVKRVVANKRLFLTVLDFFIKLGWGQVGYSGDG